MAGSPNANRTQVVYVGQLDDISSADNLVTEVNDVLGTPFIVRRIIGQVVTGVTVASVTTTLNWRPTPTSATGERRIATFEIPVLAADRVFVVDLNENPSGETVIGAGGATTGYGISGSSSFAGIDYDDMINGPGGELEFDAPDGEAGAGRVELWIEVELLSFENSKHPTAPTRVTPDAVGAA